MKKLVLAAFCTLVFAGLAAADGGVGTTTGDTGVIDGVVPLGKLTHPRGDRKLGGVNFVVLDCRDTRVCPFTVPDPLPPPTVPGGERYQLSSDHVPFGDVLVVYGDFSKGIKNVKYGCKGKDVGHDGVSPDQGCTALHSWAMVDDHAIVVKFPITFHDTTVYLKTSKGGTRGIGTIYGD